MSQKNKVVIVGGGVSGLACARTLQKNNVAYQLYEKCSQLGGRIKSSSEQGFVFDHGFQVLLSSYPIVKEFMASSKKGFEAFDSVSMSVDKDIKRYMFANPILHPFQFLKSILNGGTNVKDILANFKFFIGKHNINKLLINNLEGLKTSDYINAQGFSDVYKTQFLIPFFQGVMLEKELSVPAPFFRYLYHLFIHGKAILPNGGIQAFVSFLSKPLSESSIKLNQEFNFKLDELAQNQMALVVDARSEKAGGSWKSTQVLYFEVDEYPDNAKSIHLFSSDVHSIQNVCFPSRVNATYAPVDKKLMSLSLKPWVQRKSIQDISTELSTIYPNLKVSFLKSIEVKKSLPNMNKVNSCGFEKNKNIYKVGDAYSHPSIQGAYDSGESAALDIIKNMEQ